MREIKFRVCDKSSKKMGIVQVRQMLIPDGNNEYGNQELSISHLPFGTNPSHWLIAPILMQYTGLKDKNSQDGYFDDLVRWGKSLWQIVWNDLYGKAMLKKLSGSEVWSYLEIIELGNGEIIGNIYENPGLLEVGNVDKQEKLE